jgi:hypothetical protein
MREHPVMLNENEFKLFQLIQSVNAYPEIKNDLIEGLMRQVQQAYQVSSDKTTQKWLQVGDRTLFENIDPVKEN